MKLEKQLFSKSAPLPCADTELKRKSLNVMLVHQIRVEIEVELLYLESPCKIISERIIELESLTFLFGQSCFFRDEEIEKKSN